MPYWFFPQIHETNKITFLRSFPQRLKAVLSPGCLKLETCLEKPERFAFIIKKMRKVFACDNDFWKNGGKDQYCKMLLVLVPMEVCFCSARTELTLVLLGFNAYFRIWGQRLPFVCVFQAKLAHGWEILLSANKILKFLQRFLCKMIINWKKIKWEQQKPYATWPLGIRDQNIEDARGGSLKNVDEKLQWYQDVLEGWKSPRHHLET